MIRSVRERLRELPRFGRLLTLTWGLERLNESNRRLVYTRATLPRGARIGKRYSRFAPAAHIGRHAVNWTDSYVDADLYSRERKEQFGRPKLIFGAIDPGLRVAYDARGLYLGRALFACDCRSGATLPFVVGLLNSRMGEFLFQTPVDGAVRARRLEPGVLDGIALKVPAEPAEKRLAQFVEANVVRLINVKQARNTIRQVWAHVASYFAQGLAPLSQLLLNRLPGQKEPWVRKVAPSVATLCRRSRRFRSIRLYGDPDAPVLRLHGTVESGDDVVLAEVEFADRSLLLYTYLAAGSSQPRTRAVALRRLLEDPLVPVAGPDVTAGARGILEQLTAKVPRALADEEVPALDLDIARTDHEIERLEAMIDAEVFRVYGLGRDQAAAVMSAVNAPRRQTEQVLTFMDRIEERTAGA
jgi:hypothetical protein